MGCVRIKITQNKHKNNQRAITLKRKVTIILRDTSSCLIHIPISFMIYIYIYIYIAVTELWHVQVFFKNDFQRDITQKLRKVEHLFLCGP